MKEDEVIIDKPPVGLRPRVFAIEDRLAEIQEAINRYVQAKKDIPYEWADEYATLLLEHGKLCAPTQKVSSRTNE